MSRTAMRYGETACAPRYTGERLAWSCCAPAPVLTGVMVRSRVTVQCSPPAGVTRSGMGRFLKGIVTTVVQTGLPLYLALRVAAVKPATLYSGKRSRGWCVSGEPSSLATAGVPERIQVQL